MNATEETILEFEEKEQMYKILLSDRKWASTHSRYHKDVRKRCREKIKIYAKLIKYLKNEAVNLEK